MLAERTANFAIPLGGQMNPHEPRFFRYFRESNPRLGIPFWTLKASVWKMFSYVLLERSNGAAFLQFSRPGQRWALSNPEGVNQLTAG